jgi:glycerol-3-phosphate dehydrogenase (NAD(P)+)
MSRKFGIVGAGAWGSALAHVARSAGHAVGLWSRRLPDPAALARSDAIILAVPAQALREALTAIAPAVAPRLPLIISAKGIEQGTGLFMNEVVQELLPKAHPLVLSGPSFAADVVKGLPTAVVMAAPTLAEAGEWAGALSIPAFRIYASDDVKGVEIGGALKNVLAIACGISDGVECKIVMVPPKSLPFTSSGKLSRSAAKQKYLSGEIAEIMQPVFLQAAQ